MSSSDKQLSVTSPGSKSNKSRNDHTSRASGNNDVASARASTSTSKSISEAAINMQRSYPRPPTLFTRTSDRRNLCTKRRPVHKMSAVMQLLVRTPYATRSNSANAPRYQADFQVAVTRATPGR